MNYWVKTYTLKLFNIEKKLEQKYIDKIISLANKQIFKAEFGKPRKIHTVFHLTNKQ